MIQLSSRGRRNAPVKKMRQRWATIVAMNTQRGPVVDLAHDEPGAHVEAEADRRLVRLRHRDAAERAVAAVVDDRSCRSGRRRT